MCGKYYVEPLNPQLKVWFDVTWFRMEIISQSRCICLACNLLPVPICSCLVGLPVKHHVGVFLRYKNSPKQILF